MIRNILIVLALIFTSSFAAMQKSVTQYGITWTFDKNYEVGQYATGDWWVKGPVTVQSVSPAQIESTAQSGATNGSVLNARGNISTKKKMQGWGSDAQNYDASLRVSYPFVFQVDNSLVSTIGGGGGKDHLSSP